MPPVLVSGMWLIRKELPPCQRVIFLLLSSHETSRFAFPAISIKLFSCAVLQVEILFPLGYK